MSKIGKNDLVNSLLTKQPFSVGATQDYQAQETSGEMRIPGHPQYPGQTPGPTGPKKRKPPAGQKKKIPPRAPDQFTSVIPDFLLRPAAKPVLQPVNQIPFYMSAPQVSLAGENASLIPTIFMKKRDDRTEVEKERHGRWHVPEGSSVPFSDEAPEKVSDYQSSKKRGNIPKNEIPQMVDIGNWRLGDIVRASLADFTKAINFAAVQTPVGDNKPETSENASKTKTSPEEAGGRRIGGRWFPWESAPVGDDEGGGYDFSKAFEPSRISTPLFGSNIGPIPIFMNEQIPLETDPDLELGSGKIKIDIEPRRHDWPAPAIDDEGGGYDFYKGFEPSRVSTPQMNLSGANASLFPPIFMNQSNAPSSIAAEGPNVRGDFVPKMRPADSEPARQKPSGSNMGADRDEVATGQTNETLVFGRQLSEAQAVQLLRKGETAAEGVSSTEGSSIDVNNDSANSGAKGAQAQGSPAIYGHSSGPAWGEINLNPDGDGAGWHNIFRKPATENAAPSIPFWQTPALQLKPYFRTSPAASSLPAGTVLQQNAIVAPPAASSSASIPVFAAPLRSPVAMRTGVITELLTSSRGTSMVRTGALLEAGASSKGGRWLKLGFTALLGLVSAVSTYARNKTEEKENAVPHVLDKDESGKDYIALGEDKIYPIGTAVLDQQWPDEAPQKTPPLRVFRLSTGEKFVLAADVASYEDAHYTGYGDVDYIVYPETRDEVDETGRQVKKLFLDKETLVKHMREIVPAGA